MQPGHPIRVVMTKWGDRPHWEFPGVFLGSDEHGDWVGYPSGTLMTRPGMEFRCTNDQVGLVPRDQGFLATLHGPGGVCLTYVDMTTVPTWDGDVVSAVDLDLDVIERLDGSVFVDDEDEFAEHREKWAYPEIVVVSAVGACAAVEKAVRAGSAPFDGETHLPWLARLDAD